MKVVYKYETLNQLEKYKEDLTIEEEFIVIGKIYTVYGVGIYNSPLIKKLNVEYYLLEEDFDLRSPFPLTADLFNIIDNRNSSYWGCFPKLEDNKIKSFELVYPEWNLDPLHFENLIDGDPDAEKIFMKYKKLMDEEFEKVEIPVDTVG